MWRKDAGTGRLRLMANVLDSSLNEPVTSFTSEFGHRRHPDKNLSNQISVMVLDALLSIRSDSGRVPVKRFCEHQPLPADRRR